LGIYLKKINAEKRTLAVDMVLNPMLYKDKFSISIKLRKNFNYGNFILSRLNIVRITFITGFALKAKR